MDQIKIIGYFMDSGEEKPDAENVFVAIDEPFTRSHDSITVYAPIGQHGNGSKGYLDECEKISKEDYLKVSNGFYTPNEYL